MVDALATVEQIAALCADAADEGMNDATLAATLAAAERAEHACWSACAARAALHPAERVARAGRGVFVYAATLAALRRRVRARPHPAGASGARRFALQSRLVEGGCLLCAVTLYANAAGLLTI